MIDRKISNKELREGLIVDGVEILPPTEESTLSQLRQKRAIPFSKHYGRVFYQISELVEWANSKKVAVAS
ncbi:hypothetical protein [Sulfurimonas sp. CS5]|uniref:hypothetical protein n=1 Tax=Sulfurimonas sp. CS5 TaxID=3391145 RepID=UPI0039E95BDC